MPLILANLSIKSEFKNLGICQDFLFYSCRILQKNVENNMSQVSKTELLASLENEVAKHLSTIASFQHLSEETLLKSATNDAWSIAQCIEHLNTYGRYYLPEIKKGLEKSSENVAKSTFTGTWLGSYFTKMMLPSSKKKYKAFNAHIPAKSLDARQVLVEFIEQQKTLLSYLKIAQNKDLDAIQIPISIGKLIKLKLGDVFQFIITHDERHLQQALRNL